MSKVQQFSAALLVCSLASACSGPEDTSNASSNQDTNTPDMAMMTCIEGSKDCPCYGNGTCDGTLICEESVCVETTCPEGTEGCLCYGNNSCDGNLTCELGRCRDMMADPDMNPDMEETPDMCTPVDTCAPGACGMVGDGCGGELDCGACECVDGVPAEPTCGPCGLGQTVCSGNDAEPATCAFPAIDDLNSIEGLCDTIVYVHSNADRAQAQGSKEMPYPSIDMALAADPTPTLILVASGDYPDRAPFTVTTPTSIIGQFDDEWIWQEDGTSSYAYIFDDTKSRTVAFDVEGFDGKAVFASLLFSGADSNGQGGSTYGVRAYQAPNLVFEDFVAYAGFTGKGAHGRAGADGYGRMSGGGEVLDGGDALQHYEAKYIEDVAAGTSRNGGPFGPGGTNPQCAEAAGGDGGEGAYARIGGGTFIFDPQEGGKTQTSASGGNAGSDTFKQGGAGSSGVSGSAGMDGAPGSRSFEIQGGWWVSLGDGAPGTDGVHGQAGGGGGGAWWDTAATGFNDPPGSSGGGGGAGGCGGKAGTPGQSGGSSFGIFLDRSNNVVVRDSSFLATDGGTGGGGSLGGAGGQGGQGGQGASEYTLCNPVAMSCQGRPINTFANRGGTGGDGGAGGPGGASGAGAGGSSFGAFCNASTLTLEGTVNLGSGRAGTGGQTPRPASDGFNEEQRNCF